MKCDHIRRLITLTSGFHCKCYHFFSLGKLLILGKCIFLKREDSQSKRLAAQGIDDWLESTTRTGSPAKTEQKLLIFPEGFNSNRKGKIHFAHPIFVSEKTHLLYGNNLARSYAYKHKKSLSVDVSILKSVA